MSVATLLRPAVRVCTSGLLVIAMIAMAAAQIAAHARCDMQGDVAQHHCDGTRVQACDCEGDAAPVPLPVARAASTDPPSSAAVVVRTVDAAVPPIRSAMVVPTRGLGHAPIPILHVKLLI